MSKPSVQLVKGVNSCNRTDCQRAIERPRVRYWNVVMNAYYCFDCAQLINASSRGSGMGDLCISYGDARHPEHTPELTIAQRLGVDPVKDVEEVTYQWVLCTNDFPYVVFPAGTSDAEAETVCKRLDDAEKQLHDDRVMKHGFSARIFYHIRKVAVTSTPTPYR